MTNMLICIFAYMHICHIKDCYLCNFSRIQCICWKYLIKGTEVFGSMLFFWLWPYDPSVRLTNFYQPARHHAPQHNRPMTYSPFQFNPVTTAALFLIERASSTFGCLLLWNGLCCNLELLPLRSLNMSNHITGRDIRVLETPYELLCIHNP